MRTRRRCLRLVTSLAMTMMVVTLAGASEENAPGGSSATGDEVCIYQDGRTDTPETGPLPCDTSRRYMIGHAGFGSSRIPDSAEFSTSGPRSHLSPAGPGTGSTESSAPADGTMASPGAPSGPTGQRLDIEAP